MATSAAPSRSARSAFAGLIDYAGLFPPAQLPLEQAVAEYDRERAGSHAWMLGRFIISASLLASRPAGARASLSVILDAGADPRRWFDTLHGRIRDVAELRSQRAAIEVLEVPLPSLLAQRETHASSIAQLHASLDRAGLASLPTFVEVPRDGRWTSLLGETMETLARLGLGAKIRCGGATPEAFPSVDDVVAFVRAAAHAGVPFKATAGLHHPVRGQDAAGTAVMHGFLNLLAAAAFAPHADRDALVEIVAEEDARAFRFDDGSFWWRGERVSEELLAETRRTAFVSYGSCSFSEPVTDLAALGYLEGS